MEPRSGAERRAALLAREPRLREVARGALARSEPAPSSDPELARFAADMRALLGFEKLPDPPSSWAVKLPSGELALRVTLERGKLELRRWEGELTLFRRPASGLKRALGALLLVPPGESLGEETYDEENEAGEWRLGGRFERVLALREGRSVLLRFAPRFQGAPWERAHERPDDVLIEQTRAKRRPPSPDAIPCPLAVPGGGRFGKRPVPRKKRAKR